MGAGRHGFPAAITSAGTSCVTTEPAPTIARAPIVTPGMTKARAQTHPSSPTAIFATANGTAGRHQSWVPVPT